MSNDGRAKGEVVALRRERIYRREHDACIEV